MDREEFSYAIDCKFPYTDSARAHELIVIGCELSADAAFEVVHELARPGRGDDAPIASRHSLLATVDGLLDHPAKAVVFPIARRMIDGEVVSVEEAVSAVERLAPHAEIWSALSTIYSSCDDPDGVMEAAYEAVKAKWIAA